MSVRFDANNSFKVYIITIIDCYQQFDQIDVDYITQIFV